MHIGVEYVKLCDFSFLLFLMCQQIQVTHHELKMIKVELQKLFRPAECLQF